jgi:hypothetical protein
MRKVSTIFLAVLLLAVVASAVVPPQDNSLLKSRPAWVQAPELAAAPSLDYVARGNSRATDFPGVGRFFAENTSAWTVAWDTRSNRANLIQGSGVALIPGAGNSLVAGVNFKAGGAQLSDLEQLSRAFIGDHSDLFGIAQGDLVLDESQSGNYGSDKQLWFITFGQTYQGVPVDATVFLRVNNGNVVSFGTERASDVRGVNTNAAVSKEAALLRVLDHAGFAPGEVTELINDGELKIVPTLPQGEAAGHAYLGAPGLGYRHNLVREISFRRAGDDATYQATVDAHSGRVLELVDGNTYATVNGGVLPESTVDNEVVMTFPSNVATTAGPCTSLDGTNFRMNDNCGANDICDSNDDSSGNGEVDMGTSAKDCGTPGFGGAGNTRSSRSGMYHLSSIRNTASSFHPSNNWLNGKVTANMNINNTCNAYWSGSTLNFYRSGGGCGNTGEIAAVFLHEWGHGVDTNTGGASSDRASGEAVGDIFAAIYLQDSCIGRGFFDSGVCYNCTTCSGVRDLEDFSAAGSRPIASTANVANNSGINCDRYSCPYTGYAGVMGYEGHCEALIPGSAVWDLQLAIGWPTMEQIWYDSLIPSKASFRIQSGGQCNPSATTDGCAASNWYTVFLDVDDDDGDVSNGTPNGCAIFEAFDAYGIACGTPPAGCPGACTPTENPETSCGDGQDNDCDGYTDGADSDCFVCDPAGTSCTSNSSCCSNSCKGKPGGKTCK